MSDLPDKPPMKHEHIIERSKTVDGLFDDTIRGANKPAHPRSVSVDNEHKLSEMEKSAARVKDALSHGYFPGAIETQYEVIKCADALQKNALLSELEQLKDAHKKAGEESVRSSLDESIEDCRVALAAPFIERARLAAFLNSDKKPYQAEKMLAEAMKVQVPRVCMDSGFVRDLHKNAEEQLSKLHFENHLLELYDANLSKFGVAGSDPVLTQEALDAARAHAGNPEFLALVNYLSRNFKSLTKNHFTLFGKDGIKRSDIVNYEKERAKNINDLKL